MPSLRNPPAKGGIDGRCSGYQPPTNTYTPRSLCARAGCNQSWLTHEALTVNLNTTGSNASTSIPPMRPPEARAALLWSPPSAPGLGNTNDRRMQHARAATTSAFSANSAGLQVSAPRRPHHPFPAPSIAMRGYGPHHSHPSQRNNLTRTSLATEFIIYILPHGPSGSTAFDEHDPDLPEFRNFSQGKLDLLLSKLQANKLSSRLTLNPSTYQQVLWNEIHRHLVTHAQNHRLEILNFDLQLEVASYPLSPFVLLDGGYHVAQGQKFILAKYMQYEITLASLLKVASHIKHPSIDLPVLFYAPRGRLSGPLDGQGEVHLCLGSHVINGFMTSQIDEASVQYDCHPSCPRPLWRDNSPFSPSHPHSPLTSPLFLEDEEDTNTPAVIRPATVPVASQLSPILLSSSLRPTLSSSSSPSQDFHLYASTHASERSQTPPRPNRISSNAPSTPDLWKAKIDRQSSGQGTSIDITAPDPNQAALALISLIMKHHNQGPDPDYPIPAGVQVDAFSYDDLVGGQRRWYIHNAVGNGPERAVMRSAVQTITNSSTFWRTVGDGLVSWAVRSSPIVSVSQKRLNIARTFGTICALHVCWLQTLPHPVAPWFIYLIIQDFSSLIDTSFISSFSPQFGRQLAQWPIDSSIPLELDIRRSPLPACAQLILSYLPHVQPSELADVEPQARLSLTLSIFAFALFGCDNKVKTSSEVEAFEQGFNLVVSPSVRLIKTFGDENNTKILLKKMAGRKPTTPADLISHITVDPHPTLQNLDNLFLLWISRYLRGTGHPSTTHQGSNGELIDFVSGDMRREQQGQKVYRAERLLALVTGSELLPTQEHWTIKFRFIQSLPTRYQDVAESSLPPLIFHACSSDVDIVDGADMRRLLQQPLPTDDDDSTDFDQYIHKVVVNFGEQDDFNEL